MKHLTVVLLLIVSLVVNAQDAYERQSHVDIQRYIFELKLSDESDRIEGKTILLAKFKDKASQFSLDLIGNGEVSGMLVSHVEEEGEKAVYQHFDNKVIIDPKDGSSLERQFTIYYSGVAERGLVIDKTKFGQRSFFGDNWPTLARHWLPCIDHPYDKAAVEFIVIAPEHYDVVATGVKAEESGYGDGMKLTHYKEDAPVPMKVISIGVTRFASKYLGSVSGVPISAWVYPENRLEGFYDFQVSVDVMDYFIKNIGPYSYGKLANMQAKTQWGGLENAGAIAYNENSVTGKNQSVGLIAHEIAHQWFGNSASENDWNHVWLSEGFATYFAMLYQEHAYGAEKRDEALIAARKNVISYYEKNPSAVVDLSIREPMKVLSTNSYQKGGWTLHMLRNRLGDEVFWKGIRAYYKKYQNSNALTSDLQKVMEEVSGDDLDMFFNQWIFVEGFPELEATWKQRGKKLKLTLVQTQSHHVFTFPIEISIFKEGGSSELIKKNIDSKKTEFTIEVDGKVSGLTLDPNIKLLYRVVK